MDYLMQVDHMLLIYLVTALVALIGLLIAIFVKLRRQMQETKRLSAKLDHMIDRVLEVGTISDYNVRNKQFH